VVLNFCQSVYIILGLINPGIHRIESH